MKNLMNFGSSKLPSTIWDPIRPWGGLCLGGEIANKGAVVRCPVDARGNRMDVLNKLLEDLVIQMVFLRTFVMNGAPVGGQVSSRLRNGDGIAN